MAKRDSLIPAPLARAHDGIVAARKANIFRHLIARVVSILGEPITQPPDPGLIVTEEVPSGASERLKMRIQTDRRTDAKNISHGSRT